MQRKSSSYGCTWLLEHLKLNVLLAKFKKTLVSVKYGNTSALLGCQAGSDSIFNIGKSLDLEIYSPRPKFAVS